MTEGTEDSLKVLIVEDIDHAAQRLERTLRQSFGEIDVQVEADFDRALAVVQPPRSFEAVILDLFLGDPANGDNEGQKVWERIWAKKLIPVIVHTGGECELDPPIPDDNPFIKCFKKGKDSDLMVADHLQSLKPHILALRQVEDEFNQAIHAVLAGTGPLIWRVTEADENLRSQLLVRNARRRLAAMMDSNVLSTDEQMLSWEQYVYPPFGESLLMGDVVRVTESKTNDVTAYRLVLTPSCDTQVNKKTGKCKVDAALVAKCTDIGEYLRVAQINLKNIDEKLPRMLTEAQQSGYVPLPELNSVLPCMAANLKNLELIPIEQVDTTSGGGKKFARIVSVDSPFREHIAWAYLQIAGRPGVPDRNYAKWTQEIKEAINTTNPRAASTKPESSQP